MGLLQRFNSSTKFKKWSHSNAESGNNQIRNQSTATNSYGSTDGLLQRFNFMYEIQKVVTFEFRQWSQRDKKSVTTIQK